ncbi:MAG: hypothetical protein AAF519_06685 [Bacteroidota bacterium]
MGLKERLKRELKTDHKSDVNWEKRKNDWLNSIETLYGRITGWFSDYESEGLVSFDYSEKTHSEDYIGEYSTKKLHLRFTNGKEVVVEPMGTLIIGAWGRFDFYLRGYNSHKYYILIFKDDDQSPRWSIVNAETKKEQQPLSKRYLEKVIDTWFS